MRPVTRSMARWTIHRTTIAPATSAMIETDGESACSTNQSLKRARSSLSVSASTVPHVQESVSQAALEVVRAEVSGSGITRIKIRIQRRHSPLPGR